LEGRPILKHFEADYVRRASEVRELAARFQVESFEPDAPGLVPVEVEVHLRDGRRLSARIEDPKGSSTNPLSPEELRFKINDCLDNSVAPPSDGQRDELIEAIENTQELEDIQKLIEML
jgi:2-methylcitrate dehydratase PrpD